MYVNGLQVPSEGLTVHDQSTDFHVGLSDPFQLSWDIPRKHWHADHAGPVLEGVIYACLQPHAQRLRV
jgi:hypothetical protein